MFAPSPSPLLVLPGIETGRSTGTKCLNDYFPKTNSGTSHVTLYLGVIVPCESESKTKKLYFQIDPALCAP